MKNDVLRRCPFCGGEAAFVEGDPDRLAWVRVQCKGCSVKTPLRASHDKVMVRWNNRATDISKVGG
jgi:Lar family restriction alleviation protein